MRLLPARADDVRGLPAGGKSEPNRRGHRRRNERQPLPLRDLSSNSKSRPSRGRYRRRKRRTPMNSSGVSRRAFLTAAVATGGGLLIGPLLDSELLASTGTTQGASEVSLNAWIRISPDNVVTLISSQSEMGQGVMTTLPAVLA